MKTPFSEDVIKNVQNANDIVEIIGEYVQLTKKGRNYFGLCPFHDERTPSFSVSQEKQIFHCFGCKKGGNVVSFIMEIEGYSFLDSLRTLADRGGLSLPKSQLQNQEHTDEYSSILSAYEWLTKLYNHVLKYTEDGKLGYEYFKSRGLSEKSIDSFELGYAPNIKDFTLNFLREKGFNSQQLIKHGLLSLREDGTITDLFRGRVIYPIRNHLGKTVAFAGRTIKDDTGPKYLNSPESDFFHKSKLLYNFDLAKTAIRKENEAILFEGQMDVITAYTAGIENVIATLGSALTQYQAQLLKRYVDTVIICYDGDYAGLEASYKAALLLREAGCSVKIANLENETDPDSYIKAFGADSFNNDIISKSDTFIHFYMRFLKKDYNLSIEGDKLQYIRLLIQQVAMIDSSIEREYYLKDLSQKYHISMDALEKELNVIRLNEKKHGDKGYRNRYTKNTIMNKKQENILPAYENAERRLLASMLLDRNIAIKVQKEIGVDFSIEDHTIIATYLYAYYEEHDQSPEINNFLEKFTDENLKQKVIEISLMKEINDVHDRAIDDYITIIKRETGDIASIKYYKEQQRQAEADNNPIKAAEIAVKIIEIQKQLKI